VANPSDPLLVVSDASFPVGIVRWPWAMTFTIIAKLTFDLASSGVARLATVQEPLSIDQLDKTGTELRYASDFVPYKQGVDISVVGHARAPSPVRALPARLKVGTLDKLFKVTAEHPAEFARLSRRTIVTSGNGGGGPVGPIAALDARARGDWADPGFDMSSFNSAPADQRVAAFAGDSVMSLEGLVMSFEGLFGDGSARIIRLPTMAPTAGLFHPDGRALGAHVMRCDTIWIDTDRQIGVLVLRAVHRCVSPMGAMPVAAVSLGLDPSTNHQGLLTTHAGRPAVERSDFDSDRPPALPRAPSTRRHAGSGTIRMSSRPPPAKTQIMASSRPPAKTQLLEASLPPAKTQLLPPMAPTPPDIPPEDEVTLDVPATLDAPATLDVPETQDSLEAPIGVANVASNALPFSPQVRSAAHTVLPPPQDINDEETIDGPAPEAAPTFRAVLPFSPGAPRPPRLAVVSRHPSPLPFEAVATPKPPLYGGPPQAEPLRRIPTTSDVVFSPAPAPLEESTATASPGARKRLPSTPPEPQLRVEQYAAIKAAIFQDEASLHDILGAHGLTEMQWREEAEAWHHRLSVEAEAGGGAIANTLLAAIMSASRAS